MEYYKKIVDSIEIHNISNINNYDLFDINSNIVLKSAFFISPNEIILELKTNIQINKTEIEICQIDYSFFDKEKKCFKFTNNIIPNFEQNNCNIFIKEIDLDLKNNYIIKYQNDILNIFLDTKIDGILDNYFDATDIDNFGVSLFKEKAVFRVWSPPAGRIEIILFDQDENLLKLSTIFSMHKNDKGVFELTINFSDLDNIKSLEGYYYQYLVYAYGQCKLALDPYSYSISPFSPTHKDRIGKTAIINLSSKKAIPQNYNNEFTNSNIMDNDCDLIAYELNVRDFTSQKNVVKENIAGTFAGALNKIDYLKKLGITHVQFMPLMAFYTVDEVDRKYYGRDEIDNNYNWGYDPRNYFSLSGWFSTNAKNPYARIVEFRKLIQELHKNNIGVILDVVYNHTYIIETFENIAPGCYYRLNSNYQISTHTGAGATIETRRKMVRKLIIDSLSFFVKNFNVDGFRFDLMSFIDQETILEVRNKVGEIYNKNNINDLILHGEAWEFSDLNLSEKDIIKNSPTTKLNNLENNINLGFFNDTVRDSFTGRNQNSGFVQGVANEIHRVATGIVGAVKNYAIVPHQFDKSIFENPYNLFAFQPNNCLNYLSIHDGLTLWDKINLSWHDTTGNYRARLVKFALAMLFTSQGKIILHGGDEILRTKPLSKYDKESNRALTSKYVNYEEKSNFFHENSYSSNDFTNMFRWDRLNNNFAPLAREVLDYLKSLIFIRRNIPLLRINDAQKIADSLKFYPLQYKNSVLLPIIAYKIETKEIFNFQNVSYNKVIVIHNALEYDYTFQISETETLLNWKIILSSNEDTMNTAKSFEYIQKIENFTILEGNMVNVPYKSCILLIN